MRAPVAEVVFLPAPAGDRVINVSGSLLAGYLDMMWEYLAGNKPALVLVLLQDFREL